MQSAAWLAVQVKSCSFASMWIFSALLLLFPDEINGSKTVTKAINFKFGA